MGYDDEAIDRLEREMEPTDIIVMIGASALELVDSRTMVHRRWFGRWPAQPPPEPEPEPKPLTEAEIRQARVAQHLREVHGLGHLLDCDAPGCRALAAIFTGASK
jgi:hypothetical protein